MLSAANDSVGYFDGHAPSLETARDGDTVVVVAAVEYVAATVVGVACFPPPPVEHPTTSSATAITRTLSTECLAVTTQV
jgi:hypothetical protein